MGMNSAVGSRPKASCAISPMVAESGVSPLPPMIATIVTDRTTPIHRKNVITASTARVSGTDHQRKREVRPSL